MSVMSIETIIRFSSLGHSRAPDTLVPPAKQTILYRQHSPQHAPDTHTPNKKHETADKTTTQWQSQKTRTNRHDSTPRVFSPDHTNLIIFCSSLNESSFLLQIQLKTETTEHVEYEISHACMIWASRQWNTRLMTLLKPWFVPCSSWKWWVAWMAQCASVQRAMNKLHVPTTDIILISAGGSSWR